MNKTKEKENDKEEKKPIIVRNTTDLQRLKLEKLMKNPEKPVIIPETPKEKGVPNVPDFVRNVMGSSAGAGSGEFHVYRHLRRKEYARQKYMQERGERERLDNEYKQKLEDYKKQAEEKTAKKRAKRLKKKQRMKNAKKNKTEKKESSESSESEDETEGHKSESDSKENATDCNDSNDKNKNMESEKLENDKNETEQEKENS
ncbi:PRKR-interacting protein 1 homolog [Aethina tumida]|uniref:PRKR-interacting protein 1 homolog n=1 Tax=Aethina tumida TaxID=116153 RepID=UPI00096B12DC|nr:PRKR-interacting protein 1 homolog [Aethina tumida]